LEPRSDKESPEVESTNDKEVEITNVVIPVNVNDEEDEITDKVYELKRREKGKMLEESMNTQFPTPIRSPRTHTNLVSSNTEKLQELTGRYTYLFGHLKERFSSRKSFDVLADHLQEVMVESLPTMVDMHIKEQVKKQVPEQVRDQVLVYVAEGLIIKRQKTKEEMERMIAKSILQERGNIQAEISLQIQKAIDHHIPSQVDASLQQQDIAIWLALQMKFKNLQVNKCAKKFNPYVDRVEHMGKNSHAKIFYIKKQKEPGKLKEEVYSNSKIIQVIKTYWELGHEHKFIIEIVAKKSNGGASVDSELITRILDKE
ncbi:hypothetical protein Tco_0712924, partial [Tanacetum coccineum]